MRVGMAHNRRLTRCLQRSGLPPSASYEHTGRWPEGLDSLTSMHQVVARSCMHATTGVAWAGGQPVDSCCSAPSTYSACWGSGRERAEGWTQAACPSACCTVRACAAMQRCAADGVLMVAHRFPRPPSAEIRKIRNKARSSLAAHPDASLRAASAGAERGKRHSRDT